VICCRGKSQFWEDEHQAVISAQLLDIDRSTGWWIIARNAPRFVVEALEEERIALAMACHAVMSRQYFLGKQILASSLRLALRFPLEIL
jgi:hypothetical protein